MTSPDKNDKTAESDKTIRNAFGTAAGRQAEKDALRHNVESALDVATANAKVAAAQAQAEAEKAKREAQRRVDDARIEVEGQIAQNRSAKAQNGEGETPQNRK